MNNGKISVWIPLTLLLMIMVVEIFNIGSIETISYSDVEPSKSWSRKSELRSSQKKTTANSPKIVGELRIVVILVEFTIVKHNPANTVEVFQNFLANEFSWYWRNASFNQISWSWIIAANSWLTLGNDMPYYGNDVDPQDPGSDNFAELVVDSIAISDGFVDFSIYNYVMIVHAGDPQETNKTNSSLIWSKAGHGTYYTGEGKLLLHRATVSEMSPLGTWAHEAGHLLYLPDLYDEDEDVPPGEPINGWSLMSSGSWKDSGDQPSHLVMWSAKRLGWISSTQIGFVPKGSVFDLNVWQRETSAPPEFNHTVQVEIGPNVYYLIEVINNTAGYDTTFTQRGVLITLIDDNAAPGGRGEYPSLQKLRFPVQVIDRNNTPGDWGDELWHPTDQFFNATWNINITILAETITPTGMFYTIHIDNDSARISSRPDLFINYNSREFNSIDIWIDGPTNGWDIYVAPESDPGNRDYLRLGKENRVYARIKNIGMDPPEIVVTIRFYFRAVFTGPPPFFEDPTLKGWYYIDSRTTDLPAPSESRVVYVTWEPDPSIVEQPCILVTIDSLPNEISPLNNVAQENIYMVDRFRRSEWEPLAMYFTVTNPYPTNSARVRLDINDLTGSFPSGWFLTNAPFYWPNSTAIPYPWSFGILPNETKVIKLNVTIPETQRVGSVLKILVAAFINTLWVEFEELPGTLSDIIIVPLGAFGVEISLKYPSTISKSVLKALYKVGETLTISGTITPSHGGEPIGIYFERQEDGYVRVENVTSEPDGTYQFIKTLTSEWIGTWTVTTSWDGDGDHALAISEPNSFTVTSAPVGGIAVPVEKLTLLAPYVVLVITVVAIIIGTIYARKRWLGKAGPHRP